MTQKALDCAVREQHHLDLAQVIVAGFFGPSILDLLVITLSADSSAHKTQDQRYLL
jgi:hypothetical protein